MDAKALKYLLALVLLILDAGRQGELFAEACRIHEDCYYDELCDETSSICIKSQDFFLSGMPQYRRNKEQEEWSGKDYESYLRGFKHGYPKQKPWYQDERETQWKGSKNDFELNDWESRQFDDDFRGLQKNEVHGQRDSDIEQGPLPPEVPAEWDQIGIKHISGRGHLRSNGGSQQRQFSEHEYRDNNRNVLDTTRPHQKEEHLVDTLGARDQRNMYDERGHAKQSDDEYTDVDSANEVSRELRDSVKFNVDSSEENQKLLNSKADSIKSADESQSLKSLPDVEREVPLIPLEPEEVPVRGGAADADNSFHGNLMHSENQALIGDGGDARSLGSSAKGKVMVKGKVQQIKDNIDQGPNPEKTYKRVEDFFETQRESSIVEVPNAVKKEEASKLFKDNFIPVKEDSADEVDKEQVSSSVHKEGNIALSLSRNITATEAKIVAAALQNALWINAPTPMFTVMKVDDSKVRLKMARTDYTLEEPKDVAERIKKEPSVRSDVARSSGLQIMEADYEDAPSKDVKGRSPKRSIEAQQPKYFLITVIVVSCVTGVVLTAVAIYLIMKRHNETRNFKPVILPGQEAAADYQELCRQLRATQGWDSGPMKATHLQQGESEKGLASGRAPKYSWSEEPVVPNMDISTGHVVLAYMEDHLNNKDRLNKEWEALKTYEAEPNSREIGKLEKNARKNRYSDVLPYDHNRVLLKETASATGSDYINSSYITDHDPKNPAYIATQGPLAHTVSDFWQMVWEQGVVVIVNLTKLSDLGLPQCHRYWPEEGQPIITYRIYEVHLVSEHIWCEDYLVRSFYLKNLQTSETRTVTQFHFLTWPDLNVPSTPKPLLEFRRKVNKCFRGRASPVVVHCSGGVGRTGTYILIDMVLNKMMRGAKEIDIAATVEHLRDQRPSMVKTKAQFEFALTAVAEEVNAILKALSK